jgi:L-ribulokinase
VTAVLCGIKEPSELPRSVCAMGHKWLWNEAAGGYPSEAFFSGLDPVLAGAREKLGGVYARSDQIAGGLCPEWADKLGLKPGIPIPVAALDAHWDAVGAGIGLGDIVNVIGTSTCVMAISEKPTPIPGVFGVVPGSIHPRYAGIEAGLSAAGDIFEAIARRAAKSLAELSREVESYRSGQTGLLRLVWDRGDRTILAEPHLTGATFGWTLAHTAADELFAAIEGTAFHTRIIFERLAEYGVPVERVIHAGGIPRRSAVLNQVYANVLNIPVLLPQEDTTSVGAAVFAFLAAGAFATVEEAQAALCPKLVAVEPDARRVAVCEELFQIFRGLYFSFGQRDSTGEGMGGRMNRLRSIASELRR